MGIKLKKPAHEHTFFRIFNTDRSGWGGDGVKEMEETSPSLFFLTSAENSATDLGLI